MNKIIIQQKLIDWTFRQNLPTIVTTSFGNYSAVLLHMVNQVSPDVKIIWLDTQFNTDSTLKFKETICDMLNLNIIIYSGKPWNKPVPSTETDEFNKFVDQVKLIPFKNALDELSPTYWITGIRREETENRKNADPIMFVNNVTKISPLLDWTYKEMEQYLEKHNLPNEPHYFDPTKPTKQSECGLHKDLERRIYNEDNSTWR